MKLKKNAKQICKSLKMSVSVFLAILYRNTLLKTAGRCRFVFYKFAYIRFYRPKISGVATLITVTTKHLQMQPDLSGWCNTAEGTPTLKLFKVLCGALLNIPTTQQRQNQIAIQKSFR